MANDIFFPWDFGLGIWDFGLDIKNGTFYPVCSITSPDLLAHSVQRDSATGLDFWPSFNKARDWGIVIHILHIGTVTK